MIYRTIKMSVLCLTTTLISNSTFAQSFANPVGLSGVTVSPAGTISPDDEVKLEITLVSGSCCIYNTQPTTIDLFGDNFLVRAFAESGLLAIPDQQLELATLGTLSPGNYTYDVDLTTFGIIFPRTERMSGSFVVGSQPNADFDESGLVDGRDFLDWQSNMGTSSGATKDQGDANDDGIVDGRDLAIWEGQYGSPPSSGAGAGAVAVPEPAAAALFVVSLCLTAARRNR